MNFLAHAWLSFDVPEILAGNLISDFVKGKKKFEFASGIQKGIELHRNIDAFTDQHPATKDAKNILEMLMVYMPGHLLTLYTIISWQMIRMNFQTKPHWQDFPDTPMPNWMNTCRYFQSVSLWYLNICESRTGSIITASKRAYTIVLPDSSEGRLIWMITGKRSVYSRRIMWPSDWHIENFSPV